MSFTAIFPLKDYALTLRGDDTSLRKGLYFSLALVIGQLDYCNSLFYGLPANQINKLQRVQNAAARLVSNTPCFCHISPVMYRL
jgi:hypothetical protein